MKYRIRFPFMLSTLVLGLSIASSSCGRGADETLAPTKGALGEEAPAETNTYRIPIEGAPVLGENTAPVTIVFFSDYECPYSARGHKTIAALREARGKDVRVVVHHNPLPFHERARPAALAAIAASEQGKFWEMHERLFENHRSLSDADLERIAGEVGLDLARWRDALKSPRTIEALDKDIALSKSLGVRGTPTFFFNGHKLVGAQELAEIDKIVTQERARASALIARGMRAEEVYDTLMRRAVAPSAEEPAEECDGQSEEANAAEDKIEEVGVGTAPIRGKADAPITVVIFSDFECAFCARGESTMRELEEQFPGKIRFAYRNRPFDFHEHARLAARAALAAGEQGRFWEYHDALLSHQDALDRASLERYATELHLDMGRFSEALDSERTEAAIKADIADAERLEIKGTPTFFVNGRRLVGARSIEEFRALVERLLAK